MVTMIPTEQAWKRLIRFKATETGKIHLGQPVDPQVDGTTESQHYHKLLLTLELMQWGEQYLNVGQYWPTRLSAPRPSIQMPD